MINDYLLIDSGNGRRLEKFGKYIINRPDPEVIWDKSLPISKWQKADAVFDGKWKTNNKFPEKWQISHLDLKINLKLTPFKHTGIFPEQVFEWDLISNLVSKSNNPNVLSLFGYTGVASLIALKKGAKVTHVDASKPSITWFRENQESSGLINKPARIIIDDCIKFTEREIKRGVKYDGIIMDPPAYGHGPNGETWNFSKDFPRLMSNVFKLLSNDPIFIIINAYAVSTSPTTIANLLQQNLKDKKGSVTSGELTLKEESGGRILTTGIYAIWHKNL